MVWKILLIHCTHFGNLLLTSWCVNKNAKRSFHTATFTSWCVKMQQTFSHHNFYSLGVEKNRPSPWSHARGTSGKGLPKKNPTQQTKLLFFGWRNEQKFLQIITDLSSQQICNWALILKTLWDEISATNKVWSAFVGGLEFVAEDQILCSRLLLLTLCCKQLENPKLTALFVCLIDWLIWIFIRNRQYFCSLGIYIFQNAQFLFCLFDSAATSS